MFESLLTAKPYMPPQDQRYTVNHSTLGPWKKGAVLQANIDLVGANLGSLVASGTLIETDAPHNPMKREGESQ